MQYLRKLNHPHVIQYYTSFLEKQHLYIVMEYAEKGDLAQLIKTQKDANKYISEKDIW